ncbi:hypothetical protein ALC57_03700 [Trachymyrmex cornetzi]|uniref:Uncharacterized protein n=1 Tax=Trachymyrmex cornetzi TaxID=471704 RepID=A0A151JMD5_9HYME|nr:hypothetical protein ALC57_03700 [Trachymyrmex cornetzi]
MWGCTIESEIDNSSAGSALHLLYPPVCQSRRGVIGDAEFPKVYTGSATENRPRGISPWVPRQVHGTRCGPRVLTPDPGLNHAMEKWVYKDSDVRPSASITPSDAYSGCIAMRPLRPLFFTNAVREGSRIPKIFTSSLEGQEANEKRPSINVHTRDTKKFIKVARKIYKRDLTDRKM